MTGEPTEVLEATDPRIKARTHLRMKKYKGVKINTYDERLFAGGVIILFTVQTPEGLKSKVAFYNSGGEHQWEQLCR